MQIHYANVGSIANPQAKIISVHYIFSPPENLNFDCFGLQCRQINATQAYEFSTSVNFIGEYSKNSKIYQIHTKTFISINRMFVILKGACSREKPR